VKIKLIKIKGVMDLKLGFHNLIFRNRHYCYASLLLHADPFHENKVGQTVLYL
jgi:hypothetical protein